MALAFTKVPDGNRVEGNKRKIDWTVTFDNSYADNGETITPANVGLRRIESVHAHGPFRKSDGSDAIVVSYDAAAGKLLAFQANGAAVGLAALPEAANATDLSAYSGRITATGY